MLANDFVKAGSRATTWSPSVSAKQESAIQRVLPSEIGEDQLTVLANYVESGDLADLGDMRVTVKKWVDQAKEGLSASQAKRIWPRKVAAVAVATLA